MIRIDALEITDAILDKIETKHHVDHNEVEEACYSDDRHIRRGSEGLYEVWSRTDAGRYLLVVLAARSGGVWPVVTAPDMESRERQSYRKAKGRR